MAIRIYDSARRDLVPLDSRDPGRIAMYVCGPTVYGHVHIGNVRTFLCFDLIRRYLTYRGFRLTYVMNYTDVDDRIIDQAREEKLSESEVASKYARAFEEVMSALNVRPPDVLSLATDHVGDMVVAIERLVDKGVAYEADGNVFFAVEKFPGYGKLSHRSLEDLRAGERVEPHASKRRPLDFALWKAAKKGEPSWPSPWGPGRPGWHIECSVMSVKYLGMGFDIHGGGSDLIFPHHENEIAQAEALAGGEVFARHWLHAGMVQMESEKMSKSLGNIVMAKDVLERYSGEVVRYWALTGSYRTQVSYTESALEDARQARDRLRTFHDSAAHALGDDMPEPPRLRPGHDDAPDEHTARFRSALDDDFNSAGALAALHDLVREANRRLEGAQRGDAADRRAVIDLTSSFLELTSVLGFEFEAPASALVDGLVDYLLELREQARAEHAYQRADSIRQRLSELGVLVEDTPAGPRWRLADGPAG
jgi:cysteinyl-tRNA synthetase